jgi:acetoacetyl-CoA synthetase
LPLGVWHHGDFIVKNPKTQGFIILGRRHVFLCTLFLSDSTFSANSDGVLNPSGVRFGSAEIYTVLEPFREELDDTLCIGQRRPEDKDERVLLFVKMRPGRKFDEDLKARIRAAIRKGLSARHVPAYIFEVKDIPVSCCFMSLIHVRTLTHEDAVHGK